MDVPRISINANIKGNEPRPFIGRMTVDELRPGKFENKPWQWAIAVKPLTFAVKGNGFPNYVGISAKEIENGPNENSQFGLHMAAFKSVFGGEAAFDIGVGDLLDRHAWFIRKEHLYPVNSDGSQFKTNLLIPIRAATDEEIVEAGGEVAAPTTVVLSDEDVEAVLKVLEGKGKAQFAKAALRAKLDPKLIGHIVSGAAVEYLLGEGLAAINEDDVLVRS